MSNRTSQANKAIAAALLREQELVREGKGTRDWTPEQQKSILENGRAYDENGKAIEGHHMKSVEMFPEFQGDSDNIQFLSKAEHLAAHNGDFRNPTNGYYNPKTKGTSCFGDGNPKPCEIIKLSSPVVASITEPQKSIASVEEKRKPIQTQTATTALHSSVSRSPDTNRTKNSIGGLIGGILKDIGKAIVQNRQVIIAGIAVAIGTAVIDSVVPQSRNSISEENEIVHSKYPFPNDDDPDLSPDEDEQFSDDIDPSDDTDGVSRSSPHEHEVRGHKQRYNGVWKEKKPYTRGKNRDGD